MFGFGLLEILVILIIALVFIGPDQLPEVARVLGRLLNELKRTTDSLKREFDNNISSNDHIHRPPPPTAQMPPASPPPAEQQRPPENSAPGEKKGE
jgi:sec-independent protein translocase protein TatB